MRGIWGMFGRDATPDEVQAAIDTRLAGDAEVRQRAAAFLTPAQLEALRQSQEAEVDRMRMAALGLERMRRARRTVAD